MFIIMNADRICPIFLLRNWTWEDFINISHYTNIAYQIFLFGNRYLASYSVIGNCLIVKIFEIDHSKQTEISQYWRKKTSEEWQYISLICKNHLKACLIVL